MHRDHDNCLHSVEYTGYSAGAFWVSIIPGRMNGLFRAPQDGCSFCDGIRAPRDAKSSDFPAKFRVQPEVLPEVLE